VPSSFGDLTVQAHHLVSAGDLAGAQRLLSDALTDADPRPDHASPELAEAAGLQARVLIALGEPHSARGWAAFAYAAATGLYGRSDPRTVSAAATLAAVLHRVRSYARAARLYSDVIIELTATDGPESLRVLAAHADLATVEYARGQCAVARDRLQDAWELHREVYGDGHPSGIKMLARLGSMQRDCGEFAEAHDNLALARELCRQHLPVDDPLAAQVAALARAAANPDHVCTDTPVTEREAPVVPAARTPPPGDGPPEPPPYRPADPDPDGAYHPSGYDGSYRPSGPDPDGAYHPGGWPPAGAGHGAAVPTPRLPPDEAEAPFPDADPAGDDWWPPEPAADPDRPGGNALPPTVVNLAGGRHDDAEGVRRVHPPAEPESPSRLLPVLVPRPQPAHRPNRLLLLALAGVVVVLLGAAAVIAGVARFDGGRDAAPPPASSTGASPAQPGAASPTAGVAASPGTAPGGVTLRDNRDSIVLGWTYPAGGEGPVVISGGRAGQNPRAFQELPAGTTSWILYGLDRSTDYCFTVAVVWSTETVARAREVCTHRRG
jgi:hypothetical protein